MNLTQSTSVSTYLLNLVIN